jgi:response regulator RpfG family c-di-GMP phosphodiesterase
MALEMLRHLFRDEVVLGVAFRQTWLWSDAVDEIVQGSGTRYDPDLVDVFRQARDRLLVGA